MTLLYGRRARVLILGTSNNVIFECGGAGEYRAAFSAKLTAKSRLNDCSLSLYNLRAEDAARFTKDAKVSLEAGYLGQLGEVFKGDVIYADSARSGADIITEIDISDGKKAKLQAASLSFTPGTSFADQIKSLLDAAGGDQGFKEQIKQKLANAKGKSAYGLVVDELQALVAPEGGEVSYQGDVLQITESGKPTSDPAIILGLGSGLLAAEQMDNGRAKITAKLQAGLLPRRAILLDTFGLQTARTPNPGRYVIDLSTLQGDTHGDVWIVTTECTPI